MARQRVGIEKAKGMLLLLMKNPDFKPHKVKTALHIAIHDLENCQDPYNPRKEAF